MSADTVSTVKIARPDLPGGYLVINESDYDPKAMILFVEDKKPTRNKSNSGGR